MVIRTIVGVIGGVILALGGFGVFSGCVLMQTHRNGGDVALVAGLAAVLVGWLIIRAASRKTCPQCDETVKYRAHKCKHCGSVFT